jgi:hypothetical protein
MRVRKYAIPAAALALLVGGLLYLGVPHLQAHMKQQEGGRVNASLLKERSKTTATEPVLSLNKPTRITLKRLSIHIPVTQGYYDASNATWKLDRQHVFYIMPGEMPLKRGAHPLFYGHNIPQVLRPISGIAKDEVLEITEESGKVHVFRYVSKQDVQPEQGDAVNQAHAQQGIMLMTCSGAHYEKRQLLFFAYVGTEGAR